MAITIEPAGGLGNQLFIWAAGWSLARVKGVSLKADTVHYCSASPRSWELDSFDSGISATKASRPKVSRYRERLASLPGASRWLVTDRCAVVPLQVSQISPGARLRGYFQSIQYFEGNAEKIRQRVGTISHPSQWFLETSARLAEMGPFIGIHVRRGDYLHLPQHGVLPHHYYLGAMEEVWRHAPPDTPVIVSTDERVDLPWVSGLAPGSMIEVLRPPAQSRPIESLILLSMAGYLVAANSTWSWWAGFLGEASLVCYPDPWFRHSSLAWPTPPHAMWRPIHSGLSDRK